MFFSSFREKCDSEFVTVGVLTQIFPPGIICLRESGHILILTIPPFEKNCFRRVCGNNFLEDFQYILIYNPEYKGDCSRTTA